MQYAALLVRGLKKQSRHCTVFVICCRYSDSLLVFQVGTDTGPRYDDRGAGMCRSARRSPDVSPPQSHIQKITVRISERLPLRAFSTVVILLALIKHLRTLTSPVTKYFPFCEKAKALKVFLSNKHMIRI